MKCKFLSPILAAAALSVTATAAFSESRPITFSCETINGVPTTVATADGKTGNVFQWYADALPASVNPQQKCQEVTNKLQASTRNSGTIPGIFAGEISGLPVVCFQNTQGKCSEVLFRASSAANLNRITGTSAGRGLLRSGYSLNIWNVLF